MTAVWPARRAVRRPESRGRARCARSGRGGSGRGPRRAAPAIASETSRPTAGASMKPWPLNPAATHTPVAHLVEDRLVVGRDVVEAVDEDRERHVLEDRKQRPDALSHRREPAVAGAVVVPCGAEVARQHAAVRELLGGEAALRCDDEWFDEPLPDLVAVEDPPPLGDDRKVCSSEPGRIGAGGEHDRRGSERRPSARATPPRSACSTVRSGSSRRGAPPPLQKPRRRSAGGRSIRPRRRTPRPRIPSGRSPGTSSACLGR